MTFDREYQESVFGTVNGFQSEFHLLFENRSCAFILEAFVSDSLLMGLTSPCFKIKTEIDADKAVVLYDISNCT